MAAIRPSTTAFINAVASVVRSPRPGSANNHFMMTLASSTAFKGAIQETLTLGGPLSGDPLGDTDRLQKLTDFTTLMADPDVGLTGAVERYATGILTRASIEAMVTTFGSVGNAIKVGLERAKPTTINGQPGAELDLSTKERTIKLLVAKNPDGSTTLVSRQEGDTTITGGMLVDPTTREVIPVNATATRTYADGSKVTATLDAHGQPIRVSIDSLQGAVELTPNELGHLRLNVDGTPKDGIARDADTGMRVYYRDGKVRQLDVSLDVLEVRKTADGVLQFTAVPAAERTGQFSRIKFDAEGHATEGVFDVLGTRSPSAPAGTPTAFKNPELERAVAEAVQKGDVPNGWDLHNPGSAAPVLVFGITPGAVGMTFPAVVHMPQQGQVGTPTVTLAKPVASTTPKGVEYVLKSGEDQSDPNFKPQAPWWGKVKGVFQKAVRYVDDAERTEIERSGQIPNLTGDKKLKDVFITLDKYDSASQAQQKLQLPTKPKWRVEFQLSQVKNRTAFTEVRNLETRAGTGATEAKTSEAIVGNFVFVPLQD